MMRSIILILAIQLLSVVAKAQMEIPKDTNFTNNSTFLNEKKKNPQIQIALPIASKNIIIANDIPYKNLGYRKLNLDIIYPKKKNKEGYPVVILIFGGGWKSGDKAMCKAQASVLVNNDYFAVAEEYCLSFEAIYPAAVTDIYEAING